MGVPVFDTDLNGLPSAVTLEQFRRLVLFIQTHPESVLVKGFYKFRGIQTDLGGWLLEQELNTFSLEVTFEQSRDENYSRTAFKLAADGWFCRFSYLAFARFDVSYEGDDAELLAAILSSYQPRQEDRDFRIDEIDNPAAMQRDLVIARLTLPSWVWNEEEDVPRE